MIRSDPRLHRQQTVEHLWSRADATGGDQAQVGRTRKRLRQAESVALVCR